MSDYPSNITNWIQYIKHCLEINNYHYGEFEICYYTEKTVLSIFNVYGLINITKNQLLQIIQQVMKEKSFGYFISTRAKTDSNNYFIVLSILFI